MIEKSYTEEEIAEIVRRHGMPRYPKLALYREKLSRKAKAEPNFRFYCLYGQLLRMDVLRCAYEQVRANKGAPGVDGMTFGDIERDKDGEDGFLTSIQKELKAKTYRASPVKRVYISLRGSHWWGETGGVNVFVLNLKIAVEANNESARRLKLAG